MVVRLFNSDSFSPESKMPQPIAEYPYDFECVVKAVAVSAISGDPKTIAVIYHDDKTNKCYAIKLEI